MKKILLAVFLAGLILMTGCTKKVVVMNTSVDQSKKMFDNYIKATGFNYKLKDDENNIYNIHIMEYNMQYLLQSKPMVTIDYGFTCRFKEIDKVNTLVNCQTYGSGSGLGNIKKYIKELKTEDIKVVSYKKYKKLKENI
jgi:hypothetical protein